MSKHQTKVVLKCSGPERLTRYNEEVNSKLEDQCKYRKGQNGVLFKPTLQHCVDNSHCPLLEVKTYK